MNKEQIELIESLLKKPKHIVILPHRNPDGDALGSTLALYHFLKQKGHNPVVISPNEFPPNLAFLPGSEHIYIFEKNKTSCAEIIRNTELVFTLDFNSLQRVGELEEVLKTLTVPFIMIDHHEAPCDYAVVKYSDTAFGSTCEMMYRFIEYLNGLELIDEKIATCLYTGITTDSGSFRFPKTTPQTHRIVAKLLEKGVKNFEVHGELYDNNSYNSLQLLGRALQNLKVLEKHKTSYITLSQKELDEFNSQKGDTEGIVNYGLSVKGIIFTAIFIENKEEGIIKISLRSKGSFDVNKLARQFFNGGGHINAAGGKTFLSMQETIDLFLEVVKNHKELQS